MSEVPLYMEQNSSTREKESKNGVFASGMNTQVMYILVNKDTHRP